MSSYAFCFLLITGTNFHFSMSDILSLNFWLMNAVILCGTQLHNDQKWLLLLLFTKDRISVYQHKFLLCISAVGLGVA